MRSRGLYFFPQTTPGKYKEWGPDIDEIEIVKVFERSGYQRIIVEPLDVSQTPPPADADMAEKSAKVLAKSIASQDHRPARCEHAERVLGGGADPITAAARAADSAVTRSRRTTWPSPAQTP
jgi:hypothetical protein